MIVEHSSKDQIYASSLDVTANQWVCVNLHHVDDIDTFAARASHNRHPLFRCRGSLSCMLHMSSPHTTFIYVRSALVFIIIIFDLNAPPVLPLVFLLLPFLPSTEPSCGSLLDYGGLS
jgi:hypothetical protein